MTSRGARRGIRLAALRVPLVAKLVGANLLVVGLFTGIWLVVGGPINAFVIVAITAVVSMHLALTLVALRPIRDLEAVATRVWDGDYGVRVERSAVADREVLRVGSMFNILLDGLAADRAKMRVLAAEVIAAEDRERSALARELHDSVAQHLAAVLLQLSAAARDSTDPLVAERLHEARDSAEYALHEARALSHALHPGVLDDLGLEAALRKLARDSSYGNGVDIDVDYAARPERLPRDVEGVLYRVAQEAVRNATTHASPRRIRMSVQQASEEATLSVHDDGVGFDLADADARRAGMGLTSMRERVDLLDGHLDIHTAKGSGTTISATVPLDAASRPISF
ncbi:MAG TPA: sensor histidine kinase [Gemmatimonadaceae bacterium]|nr:sensor histidine kinase [Gemmatimonadaceae bacterium]